MAVNLQGHSLYINAGSDFPRIIARSRDVLFYLYKLPKDMKHRYIRADPEEMFHFNPIGQCSRGHLSQMTFLYKKL